MPKRKPVQQATLPPLRRRPDWLPQAAALAVLAVAAYANSIGNGFVGDDKLQLVQNPLLTDFVNIPVILRSSVWSIIGIPGNYYRPFQFLVYMLLYKVAGFQAPAFHLFLVVLNAGNTVLLYLFVRRFATPRVAVAAAALFAAHPIHTESVNWIACLPDVMLTTVALGGLLWFASRSATAHGAAILGHCGIYLVALLTKETGAMVAPLYAAYGFLLQGRGWQELRLNARLYAWMAVTFGVYVAMRVSALGGFAPGQAVYFHLSTVEFFLSAVVTAAQYFRVLLWPATLNYFHVFYPTRAITGGIRRFGAAAGVARARLIPFAKRSRVVRHLVGCPHAGPALNLTGVGQNIFAERYLYLPSAGLCWIAGWAWDRLAKGDAGYGRRRSLPPSFCSRLAEPGPVTGSGATTSRCFRSPCANRLTPA